MCVCLQRSIEAKLKEADQAKAAMQKMAAELAEANKKVTQQQRTMTKVRAASHVVAGCARDIVRW
jgi:hypothetical protein